MRRPPSSNAAARRQGVGRRPAAGGRPCAALAIVLALAALVLASCVADEAGSGKDMPTARRGVLDLTGWDMAADGPVRLDGEWEFYPHQLLTPQDLLDPARSGEARTYLLPAPWNREQADGGAMGADAGFATVRLRLEPGPGASRPALSLGAVNAAFRLWIDGTLAASSGEVGTDALSESPKPSTILIPFDAVGRPVELVMQASNFHYRDGGLVTPIWFGPFEALLARHNLALGAAMFFVGSFFVMGLYHLALYWFRPKNIAPLYFALYCFAWMGNYAASDTSGFVLRLFVPGIGAHLLDQLALCFFFVSIPVGFAFFRSLYPAEFSRRLQQACLLVCAGYVAVAVFAPGMFLARVLPVYYLISGLLILYCLHRLYTAVRRGRDAAAFLLAGFSVLGLVGINDMLTDMKLVASTPLLPVGMLAFSLVQAMALSSRLSRAFTSEERLSAALEDKNASLTAEMAERTRLERQIVTISEEERRRISLELHDGLCQGLTAARLRCDALSPHMQDAGSGGGELARLSGLLDAMVDQAYDLSRGLWPLEHDSVGVGPSFRELVHRLALTGDIPVSYHRERACETCRNPHMTQLYRIAQEAVTNAVKHSRARGIEVSLTCPGGREALLTVRDDGRGRREAGGSPGGLGLGVMTHRARLIGGVLRIEDLPGGGTLVACSVSCQSDGDDPGPGRT